MNTSTLEKLNPLQFSSFSKYSKMADKLASRVGRGCGAVLVLHNVPQNAVLLPIYERADTD